MIFGLKADHDFGSKTKQRDSKEKHNQKQNKPQIRTKSKKTIPDDD